LSKRTSIDKDELDFLQYAFGEDTCRVAERVRAVRDLIDVFDPAFCAAAAALNATE
jgi:hypothetical protein